MKRLLSEIGFFTKRNVMLMLFTVPIKKILDVTSQAAKKSLKVGSRYSREIIPLKNKYQKVYLSYLLIFKLLINYIYKNCYSVPVLSIQYIQYMWFRY